VTVDDEIESCIGKREQISFDWNYPDSERTQSRLRDRDIRRITFGCPGIARQRSQRFQQLTAAGSHIQQTELRLDMGLHLVAVIPRRFRFDVPSFDVAPIPARQLPGVGHADQMFELIVVHLFFTDWELRVRVV